MENITSLLSTGCLTRSPAETEDLAARFARMLPPDSMVTLSGGLGAGKSTFVRGMAKAWGIDGPVTSPSYSLLNCYEGKRQLLHVDAYRLEHPEEAEELLIEDWARSPWCLVIEWPENVPAHWLEHAWQLKITLVESSRHLRLLTHP